MTQQHNYEHTVTFSFLIFFVESEENEGKRDRFCFFGRKFYLSYADTRLDVQLWFRRFVSVYLLTHMKQEAFWVTIYVAMFNITDGFTTEMSVKIGLLKIKPCICQVSFYCKRSCSEF